MSNQEEKDAYIFGTDPTELNRLGLQHQAWSRETQKSWELAGFRYGQTLLDLGCGPGFCTQELAYLVGPAGKVIGIDQSRHYVEFVKRLAELHGLNIEGRVADFTNMKLERESLDGVYCRWALAWVENPEAALDEVCAALRPEGRIVLHEYYDWSTFQSYPVLPNLKRVIAQALQSIYDSPGDVGIGRRLPGMLHERGLKIVSIRPLAKVATPNSYDWLWPKSFLIQYARRIAEQGYLTEQEAEQTVQDFETLEQTPGASIMGAFMTEVIAEKI